MSNNQTKPKELDTYLYDLMAEEIVNIRYRVANSPKLQRLTRKNQERLIEELQKPENLKSILRNLYKEMGVKTEGMVDSVVTQYFDIIVNKEIKAIREEFENKKQRIIQEEVYKEMNQGYKNFLEDWGIKRVFMLMNTNADFVKSVLREFNRAEEYTEKQFRRVINRHVKEAITTSFGLYTYFTTEAQRMGKIQKDPIKEFIDHYQSISGYIEYGREYFIEYIEYMYGGEPMSVTIEELAEGKHREVKETNPEEKEEEVKQEEKETVTEEIDEGQEEEEQDTKEKLKKKLKRERKLNREKRRNLQKDGEETDELEHEIIDRIKETEIDIEIKAQKRINIKDELDKDVVITGEDESIDISEIIVTPTVVPIGTKKRVELGKLFQEDKRLEEMQEKELEEERKKRRAEAELKLRREQELKHREEQEKEKELSEAEEKRRESEEQIQRELLRLKEQEDIEKVQNFQKLLAESEKEEEVEEELEETKRQEEEAKRLEAQEKLEQESKRQEVERRKKEEERKRQEIEKKEDERKAEELKKQRKQAELDRIAELEAKLEKERRLTEAKEEAQRRKEELLAGLIEEKKPTRLGRGESDESEITYDEYGNGYTTITREDGSTVKVLVAQDLEVATKRVQEEIVKLVGSIQRKPPRERAEATARYKQMEGYLRGNGKIEITESNEEVEYIEFRLSRGYITEGQENPRYIVSPYYLLCTRPYKMYYNTLGVDLAGSEIRTATEYEIEDEILYLIRDVMLAKPTSSAIVDNRTDREIRLKEYIDKNEQDISDLIQVYSTPNSKYLVIKEVDTEFGYSIGNGEIRDVTTGKLLYTEGETTVQDLVNDLEESIEQNGGSKETVGRVVEVIQTSYDKRQSI